MSVGKNRPVALITGASGGIGAELAGEIARDGYDVVLVARNAQKLDEVGADLSQKFDVEWLTVAMDLTAPSQVDELFATLESKDIEPELIVNNAGYGIAGAAASAANDIEGQLGSVDLNVSVLSDICLRFLPKLVAKDRGGIINVGSVVGFFPGPYFATYYATKAYVRSFTQAIAHEVKASRVKICLICPGATATDFHRRAGIDRKSSARSAGFMSAKEVAKIGYAGYKKGRGVVVTGVSNRILVFLSRLIPSSWFAYLVARFNKV